MSEVQWAPYGDALKLILTGSASTPLTSDQRGIFENMLACGMRDDKGKRTEERQLPGVQTQKYCLDEDKQEYETMYYIPDLFKYMVTAFHDCAGSALPVDLTYLKRLLNETEEKEYLTLVLRKIEIQQEIAELDRTRHGGDPIKLESQKRGRAKLNVELAEVAEKIEAEDIGEREPEYVTALVGTAERNKNLQAAANAFAMEWKQNNRTIISKRKIAEMLAKSNEWKEMIAATIERILRKEW